MDKKTILKLYNTFAKELPAPDSYKKIRAEFENKRYEVFEKLGDKARLKIEELFDLIELSNNELMKQAYIEGFSMATNLIMESIENKKENYPRSGSGEL